MKTFTKKIFAPLCCIALVVSMQFSCVDEIKFGDAFLEKAPGVDVTMDTVFSKAEYTRYFLWNLYSQLYSMFLNAFNMVNAGTDAVTDCWHSYQSWAGSYAVIYPGDATETTTQFHKFNASSSYSIWAAMRRGWLLIENMDRVPDLSETEKSQMRGEAYCIMASRYIDGLKTFGGLPIVDHAYAADEFYERGRGSVAETVEFIDSLLTCAINEPSFVWRWEDQQTWAGRISKSVAYALRAWLYTLAASPIFNATEPYMQYPDGEQFDPWKEGRDIHHVWYGDYQQSRWEKAQSACEDFFRMNAQNGGWYALIQPQTQDEYGYSMAYRAAYWYRGNSEKVFEIHHTYTHGEWTDQNVGPGNVAHQGHWNPTLEFMEMFGMQDGRNYPYKNIYGTLNPDNIDIMANRDPRMYETIVVTRERMLESYRNLWTVEIWKGGNVEYNTQLNDWTIRFLTGMALFKWTFDYRTMANYPVQWSYLRMADMHLLYAECLAQNSQFTAALDEIHKVRSRVGLGRLEVMNPELQLETNKENLIKEILRERAVEFGIEDRRYWDMCRYKLVDAFTTQLYELHTWRKTADGQKDLRANTEWDRNTEPYPNFIYEKQPIQTGPRKWWEPGAWTNKWLLNPIPRSEINKGYGLTQNPGW